MDGNNDEVNHGMAWKVGSENKKNWERKQINILTFALDNFNVFSVLRLSASKLFYTDGFGVSYLYVQEIPRLRQIIQTKEKRMEHLQKNAKVTP